MGGNIFNGISRMNNKIYIIIKFILFRILEKHCDLKFPFNRKDKITHGDIDVVYVLKNSEQNIRDLITLLFNPTERSENGPIFSFVLTIGKKKYHIDMIDSSSYGFDTVHFYVSYGDIGNILSMILAKYNDHFGNQGFFVKKKIGGEFKVYILAKCPREICDYLNLNYDVWTRFKNMDEIIDWMKTIQIGPVPVFKPNIFNNSNANAGTKRLMNRPFFCKFMETISDSMTSEKETYLDLCDSCLVHFGRMDDYIQDNHDYLEKKKKDDYFKGKYNRGMLAQKPFNLKGNAIVKFDILLKESIPNFEEWVLKTDANTIHEKIKEILITF